MGHTARETRRVRVHVSSLRLGMYICELDRPWLDTPFLLQGFLLESLRDIDIVQELCEYVYIDAVHEFAHTHEQHSRHDHPAAPDKRPSPPAGKTLYSVPAREEQARIQAFHAAAKRLARQMLDDVRLGNALNVQQVKDTVHECIDSIIRNPDALLWLSRIKNKDEYTAEHSLNVGILAISFGHHLGKERPDLEKLGLCGMLHDIGKTQTPLEILNKTSHFTPEEAKVMRRHAEDGQRILLDNQGVYYGCIDVCHNHHEALDGSGYPRGLTDQTINEFTRIVSICDVYDAITSDRCYKRCKSSLDALRILYEGRGQRYDTQLVIEFIRCIGLYPVGSLVELENHSIGIVTSNNPADRRLPSVYIIIDETGETVRQPFTLDLAKITRHGDLAPYRIRKVLPNGTAGIRLQDYVARGLQLA